MSDNKNERIHSQDEALARYFDDLLMTPSLEKTPLKQQRNLKLVHSSLPSVDEMIAGVQIQNTGGIEMAPVEEEIINLAEEFAEPKNVEQADVSVFDEASVVSDYVECEPTELGFSHAVKSEAIDHSDGRPAWATDSFEAVVLVINNMKFAVPKFAVNGRRVFTKELEKLASQPKWVMGLKLEGDSFVAAVDTAHLLLNVPAKNIADASYTELVVLTNSRWGLAVDGVLDEILIQSIDVNWRKDATTRTWLCGTEAQQQLAIIEPSNLFKDNQ